MTIGIREVSMGIETSSSSGSPADCEYGIELTREMSVYESDTRPQAWRMKVTVTDTNNVTPNIFVYMRKTTDPGTGLQTDTFESVASPVDLEEYPAGAPIPGTEPQFYRLSEIDLIARNRDLLDGTWNLIVDDRDELLRTLATICELDPVDVDRGGTFPSDAAVEADPEVTDPETSSEPEVCPYDGVMSLKITASDDADFPIGAILTPVGIMEAPPTCEREWECTGLVTGEVLSIITSTTVYVFEASIDDVVVDSGGISAYYRALITYIKPSDGIEHNLEIIEV